MFGQNRKPATSGVEMMLRSMGLGEAIDATKTLIESGAIKDFLEFVRDLKGLRHDIACMRRELAELKYERDKTANESIRGELRALAAGSNPRPVQSNTILARSIDDDESDIDGRNDALACRVADGSC